MISIEIPIDTDHSTLSTMAVDAFRPEADFYATQRVGFAMSEVFDAEVEDGYDYDRARVVGLTMRTLIENIRNAYPRKSFNAGAIVENLLWGYERAKGEKPADWQMMAAAYALDGENDLTLTLARLRHETHKSQFAKNAGNAIVQQAITGTELPALGEN